MDERRPTFLVATVPQGLGLFGSWDGLQLNTSSTSTHYSLPDVYDEMLLTLIPGYCFIESTHHWEDTNSKFFA